MIISDPEDGDILTLPVREDSGTEPNWMSPKLADRYSFTIEEVRAKCQYLDFRGEPYVPTKKVMLECGGKKNKSNAIEFFIAPDGFPVDLSLGACWLNEFGSPQDHFLSEAELREEEETKTAHILVQKRITVSEHSKRGSALLRSEPGGGKRNYANWAGAERQQSS